MHILVVEPDLHLSGIVGDLLTADGHVVMAAADGRGAVAALGSNHVDVLLVSDELPDMRGAEVVHALRQREPSGAKVSVFLVVHHADESVRAMAAGLGVTELLTRPVSLLDLGDHVRRCEPVPGATTAAASYHVANASSLAGLWARRATGVLRVEQPSLSAWVLFANGGPVGADGHNAVRAALEGGELELETCPVDGPGDREGLGALLWDAARASVARTSLPPTAAVVVAPNRLTPEASALPIRPIIAGILRGIEGPTPLRRVLEALPDGNSEEIHADLAALASLGLLDLRQRSAERLLDTTLDIFAVDRFTDTSGIVLRPETRGRTTEIVDTDPTDPRIETHRPPSSHTVTRVAPRRTSLREVAPILERALREAADFGPIDPAPRPPEPVRTRADRAEDPGRSAVSTLQLLARLRREAEALKDADPWVILGIPRSTPAPATDAAGKRMMDRYTGLSRSSDPEIARLAKEIGQRVAYAVAHVQAQRPPEIAVPPAAPGPADGALALGRRAEGAQRWVDADHHYTRARELAPDSPEALAHLGWARFNNPLVDGKAKVEDAVTFLELAIQYDPTYVDAWWFLASTQHRAGRLEQAAASVRQVLKLSPRHAEAIALQRLLGM